MRELDPNYLLAVLGVVLAAVALPPTAAVPVLAFLVGLLTGRPKRSPPP
jgi:hypothetical protein